MFRENDFVNISVLYYDKKGMLIGASKIPSNYVTIPESCYIAKLVEYTNDCVDYYSLNNYYIGNKATFSDLIKYGKTISISDQISEEELKRVVANDTLVEYKMLDDKCVVNRVLNGKEIVFSSIDELKHYLVSLSSSLNAFNKNTACIKRKIYNK